MLTCAGNQDIATNHYATCALIAKVDGVTTEAGQGMLSVLPYDDDVAMAAVSLMTKTGQIDEWISWLALRGGVSFAQP
jgi:hypothetical protein